MKTTKAERDAMRKLYNMPGGIISRVLDDIDELRAALEKINATLNLMSPPADICEAKHIAESALKEPT